MENWTFSLFFCVAELWGAVVISVLFWTLANEVCTVKEAKTIYPLMGIAANVALVAAGNFMKAVTLALPVRSNTLVLHCCNCVWSTWPVPCFVQAVGNAWQGEFIKLNGIE